MQYRPEIDGLRAIAILPVVFFHAKWDFFSGGFVGVDVFFVISGYLITSIILKEIATGKFALLSFYERRIRRILPALYLMVFSTIPLTWFFFLPEDMKDYAESLAAVPVFLSNFVFEAQSGYFDRATDIKPLIHTWSLAVEEQFYLFFPIFLVFLMRFGLQAVMFAIIVIASCSFVLAEWGTKHAPTDSFFLLPTRVWELFTGVTVALYVHLRGRVIPNDLLAMVGLMMVLIAIFFYETTTPFPGFYALLPTIGTALVILCAQADGFLGKVLSNRLLVAIGLISFSLYLWHQPILAIATYNLDGQLPIWLSAVLIMLSVGLSVLSYRYVEQPCRDRAIIPTKPLLVVLVAASFVFFAIGFYGVKQEGNLHRFNQQTLEIANPPPGIVASLKKQDDGALVIGIENVAPSIIFMGDSHTAVLTQSLDAALKARGISALVYLTGPCPPLLGVLPVGKRGPICKSVVESAFQTAVESSEIDQIVLHAQWSNYTTGTRWGRRSLRFLSDERSTDTSLEENQRVFEAGLERSITHLGSETSILIIKSVPEYNVLVPNFLAKVFHRTGKLDDGRFRVTKQTYRMRNTGVEDAFSKVAQQSNLRFLEPFLVFCPNDTCQMFDDKMNVLYLDGNHLSRAGADILTKAIQPSID